MTALSQKTRELIAALNDLGNAAGRSATNIQEVKAFLNDLARPGYVGGFEKISAGIREMSAAFRQLGSSKDYIKALENELATLYATTKRYSGGSLRGGGGAIPSYKYLEYRAKELATGGRALADIPVSQQAEVYNNYRRILAQLQTQAEATRQTLEKLAKSGDPRGKGIWAHDFEETKGPIATLGWAKQLDLPQRGIENLTAAMKKYNVVGARVVQNSTEASTGITRIRLAAGDANKGVRTFSATMDSAGNILNDTQKRFRTFGDAIVRDTIEVLKWTIAIGLIYGPMRKLSELIEQSRQIQESLIDVQITLGETTANLGAIFQSAAQIADETSSSIEGVLGGYSEALAATGSIENPVKRVATANALLRDSMVLSKLAGIDQAEALDTLVGALRQTDGELYDSQALLDKWVATSKNANVSLNQLASTFAIVGSAAEEVGISADELNAIVGTLAEATKLSADETGNAIRGFISGFQSAKAESTLARFGIAVRTTSGEVRSFTDLLNELAVLQQEGILSERNVAEITNVIGGGFRRGAQLSALMSNYNRILQLTEVSQNASGDAAEALELKMSTLESAITRLSTAFARLAQSLGQEGGALGGLTALVDGVTALTNALGGLVRILGTAAPLLATIGLVGAVGKTGTAASYLGKNIPAALAYLFAPSFPTNASKLGGIPGGPPGLGIGGGGIAPNVQVGPQQFQTATWAMFLKNLSQSISTSVSNALSKIPIAGGALSNLGLGGLVVPGVLAGTQIAGGEYEKAGFTLGGAFLGALTSGGGTVATALASVFASAFYDEFIKFDEDIASRWGQVFIENLRKEGAGGTGLEEETPEEELKRLQQELVATLGIWERFVVNSRAFFAKGVNLQEIVRQQGIAGEELNLLPTEGLTGEDVLTAAALLQRGGVQKPTVGITDFDLLFGGAAPGNVYVGQDTLDAFNEFLNKFLTQQIKEGIILTPTQERIKTETKELSSIAATVAEEMVQDAIDQIAQGETEGVQNYLRASGIQNALAVAAANLIVAIEQASEEVGIALPVPTREEAIRIVAETTPEQMELIAKVTGEIVNGLEEMRQLSKLPILSTEEAERFDELKQQVLGARDALQELIPAIQQANTLAEFERPPVIDLPEELTPEQVTQIIQLAEQYERYMLQAFGKANDEIEQILADRQLNWFRVGPEILDQQSFAGRDAVEKAQEALGFGTGADKQLQILDLRNRLGAGQFQAFLQRYAQIVTAFKQNVPGFELDQSQVAIILKEGLRTLDLDMRLANLALADLVELQREQMVEGMFNLPTGGTFFVPFEPAALDARSRVGGGGSAFDPNSFWAQFEPDPDALEAAAERGTEKGVLSGLEMLVQGIQYGPAAPKPDEMTSFRDFAAQLGFQLFGPPKPLDVPSFPNIFKPPTATEGGQQGGVGVDLPGNIETWLSLFVDLPTAIDRIGDIPDAIEKLIQLKFGAPGLGEDTTGGGLDKYRERGPKALEKGDLSTRLSLDVNTNVQLMLDGRVIAEVVKPYLYEDLIRYEGAAGTNTLSVTV